MEFSILYLPVLGPKAELLKGLAGRRNDLYQSMLSEIREQVQLADQAGFYGVFFTEHHLDIEGFEISNNPVLLDLYVAQATQRIRVGQAGICLPVSSPLRVAEDLAMLDHMTGGRTIAGFALGAQTRWIYTFGQHILGPQKFGEERHELYERLFRESYDIIKQAWTQDAFSYQGETWQIPPASLVYPNMTAQKLGLGVGADDIVTKVGIAPRPLQQPHIPVWRPFTSSESTIRWCAQQDVVPMVTGVSQEKMDRVFDVYQEEAALAGRSLRRGQNMALFRDVLVADTDEEAQELAADGSLWAFLEWQGVVSNAAEKFRLPGETGPMTPRKMLERRAVLVGSPDTVCREIEEHAKRYDPSHYVFLVYQRVIPHRAVMRSLELLATKVIPNFSSAVLA